MTAEEAIKKLGGIRTGNLELAEALNAAIEALKAEPCNPLKLDGMLEDAYEYGYEQARHDFEVQPCEEAVSKRAVLDAIKNNYRMAAIDVIEKLPPVTPARIKGKWIKQKIGYGCSNCTLCTNDYGVGIYKYCPNCGADMREGISE